MPSLPNPQTPILRASKPGFYMLGKILQVFHLDDATLPLIIESLGIANGERIVFVIYTHLWLREKQPRILWKGKSFQADQAWSLNLWGLTTHLPSCFASGTHGIHEEVIISKAASKKNLQNSQNHNLVRFTYFNWHLFGFFFSLALLTMFLQDSVSANVTFFKMAEANCDRPSTYIALLHSGGIFYP